MKNKENTLMRTGPLEQLSHGKSGAWKTAMKNRLREQDKRIFFWGGGQHNQILLVKITKKSQWITGVDTNANARLRCEIPGMMNVL